MVRMDLYQDEMTSIAGEIGKALMKIFRRFLWMGRRTIFAVAGWEYCISVKYYTLEELVHGDESSGMMEAFAPSKKIPLRRSAGVIEHVRK